MVYIVKEIQISLTSGQSPFRFVRKTKLCTCTTLALHYGTSKSKWTVQILNKYATNTILKYLCRMNVKWIHFLGAFPSNQPGLKERNVGTVNSYEVNCINYSTCKMRLSILYAKTSININFLWKYKGFLFISPCFKGPYFTHMCMCHSRWSRMTGGK